MFVRITPKAVMSPTRHDRPRRACIEFHHLRRAFCRVDGKEGLLAIQGIAMSTFFSYSYSSSGLREGWIGSLRAFWRPSRAGRTLEDEDSLQTILPTNEYTRNTPVQWGLQDPEPWVPGEQPQVKLRKAEEKARWAKSPEPRPPLYKEINARHGCSKGPAV
jgi:hypothetical protein